MFDKLTMAVAAATFVVPAKRDCESTMRARSRV